MNPQYDPRIFIQDTIEHAQCIILTPEVGLTTQERWEQETEWLRLQIDFPSTTDLLLDYGCGIGRVSRILENPVLGIDISHSMRQHALLYVNRPGFATTHPPMLRFFIDNGLRAKGGVAIWALQHVLDLGYDTQLIFDALAPDSYFWTLDGARRYVPASYDDEKFIWIDDGESVPAHMDASGFTLIAEVAPPLTLCGEGAKLRHWYRP